METLSSNISRPRFLDSSVMFQSSSSCKSSTSLFGFSNITLHIHYLSNRWLKARLESGLQSRAYISSIPGLGNKNDPDPVTEKGDQEKILDLVSEDASSIEDSTGRASSADVCDENLMISPVMVGLSGGSRAIRTPISGGVHSATSAHDLPRPALAVRNLMEQVRFAHLCTTMSRMHHRRQGYPFGSLVDFAPDSMGHPIFSFSPLAIHTRNLLADPRCSLVIQVPGWSGVTIFGKLYPLPADKQEWAHQHYTAKHQQGKAQQWGNFYYYRMESISDIYFIGGFGTVAWVDVNEYETVQPDKIAVNGGEQHLKELNTLFSKHLKKLLSAEAEIDDAALISIDSKGADVRVRQGTQFNIQRIPFHAGHKVETLEDAKAALQKLVNKASKLHLF